MAMCAYFVVDVVFFWSEHKGNGPGHQEDAPEESIQVPEERDHEEGVRAVQAVQRRRGPLLAGQAVGHHPGQVAPEVGRVPAAAAQERRVQRWLQGPRRRQTYHRARSGQQGALPPQKDLQSPRTH